MGEALTGGQLGAIWDLDGTLVDTERHHYESWRALLAEHGKGLTYEQFRPTFGLRNDDVLVHHFGFERSDDLRALADRKEDLFLAALDRDGVHIQRGAAELVEHLRALGFVQAIASSAPPRNIAFIVERLPFGKSFEAVVSSEEIAHGKPAPDIDLRAAERLYVAPERCVVLEDAPAGVAAGKAAGCKVIAIAAGFDRALLTHADVTVDSFDEVLWPERQWADFIG